MHIEVLINRLRDEIVRQANANSHDAPWIAADLQSHFIRIDGQLDLRALAVAVFGHTKTKHQRKCLK